MLKEFLSLCWNPVYEFLVHSERKKETNPTVISEQRNFNPLELALYKNKELHNLCLFFTPNGNYGDLISSDKVCPKKGIRTKNKNGNSPHWNMLFVELDIKWSWLDSHEALREEAEKTFSWFTMRPSFVSKTPWWWHLYRPISKDAKQSLSTISNDDMSLALKELWLAFVWWDTSSMAVNKLMRVPTSYHRKTWEPILVEFYQYYDDWLQEIYDEDKIQFMDNKTVRWTVAYALRSAKWASIEKKFDKQVGQERMSWIYELDFERIFDRLHKYPRLYKWKTYQFSLWKNNTVDVTVDWSTFSTDWYKLCKRTEWDFINCFSMGNHPIEERPRWPIVPFLYHYFDSSIKSVNKFLTTEFDINILDLEQDWLEWIDLVIVRQDSSITFSESWVTIKHVVMKEGSESVVTKEVIKIPIKMVSRSFVYQTEWFLEWEKGKRIYIVETDMGRQTLERRTTKKSFNDFHDGIFRYGVDNDLWLFFDSLERAEEIPIIKAIEQNGHYDWYSYLWWELVHWKTDSLNLISHKYAIKHSAEKISIKQSLEDLRKVWKKRIIDPVFCQCLAMQALNLRWWHKIYPWILITGKTWWGKSTISAIMQSLLWYETGEREEALPWITPQPLKEKSTDFWILFFEELTNKISSVCEENLRLIINRNTGARGTTNGNLRYVFRSPLFITWERTFKEESLNNRVAVITNTKQDINKEYERTLRWEIIGRLEKSTFLKEYLSTIHKVKFRLEPTYKIKRDILVSSWLDNRFADAWAYWMAMIDLFDLDITNEEYISYVRHHLWSMWFLRKESSEDCLHTFKTIVIQASMDRSVIWTYMSIRMWKKLMVTFMDEFYEKKRSIINTTVSQMQERWIKAAVNDKTITVMFNDIDSEKTQDAAFAMMRSTLQKMTKNVIHNEWRNDSIEYNRYGVESGMLVQLPEES